MQTETSAPHDTHLPLQRSVVIDALKRALREMPDLGHTNVSHPTLRRFTYAPYSCNGCARAVIARLIKGEELPSS